MTRKRECDSSKAINTDNQQPSRFTAEGSTITYCASLWDEDMIWTAWKHAESGRNDLARRKTSNKFGMEWPASGNRGRWDWHYATQRWRLLIGKTRGYNVIPALAMVVCGFDSYSENLCYNRSLVSVGTTCKRIGTDQLHSLYRREPRWLAREST